MKLEFTTNLVTAATLSSCTAVFNYFDLSTWFALPSNKQSQEICSWWKINQSFYSWKTFNLYFCKTFTRL